MKLLADYQTEQTIIRLHTSLGTVDIGLHCWLMHVCSNNYSFSGISKKLKLFFICFHQYLMKVSF